MGFYIQDDMWEAVSELPRKTQDEVDRLAREALLQEGEQTPLKGGEQIALRGLPRPRHPLDQAQRVREAKRQAKGKANGEAKRGRNGEQRRERKRSKIGAVY